MSSKNCMSAVVEFRNPKALDYRLPPNSPCRGKASDKGDIGVRYTPDMLEMSKAAAALVAKGLIKLP